MDDELISNTSTHHSPSPRSTTVIPCASYAASTASACVSSSPASTTLAPGAMLVAKLGASSISGPASLACVS